MRAHYTSRFNRDFNKLQQDIKKKLEKQIKYLLRNIRHPSLRAKKYNEENNIWQARVDRDYRFYFILEKDCCILLNIKSHTK